MTLGASVDTWKMFKKHLQPYYFFNQSYFANKNASRKRTAHRKEVEPQGPERQFLWLIKLK